MPEFTEPPAGYKEKPTYVYPYDAGILYGFEHALFLIKKAKSKDAAIRAVKKALADKQDEQKRWGRLENDTSIPFE